MTRALEPLRQPLAPGPELEPLDPRLTALTDAAERRQFRDAADRAEALFAEGVYDVRAVSIYLYQAFVEGGLGALGEIFETADALAGSNLAALSPARRREEHLDRRLGWLFDAVNDALEYHALKNTPEWGRWRAGVTPDAFALSLGRGDALGERLRNGPFKTGDGALGRLLTRLRGLATALEPPPAPSPAPAPPEAPAAAAPSSTPAVAFAAVALLPPNGEPPRPSRHRIELVASDRFIELLCKLKAFEALVERKHYQKAALVGDDLMRSLDEFDPRAHFPDLFATFSALLSQHVDQISPHLEDRESPSWKALTQFYRVDLKGFVGG